MFACTSCSGTYTNIDGHCLVAPYAYNSATLSTPVITITFNTFAQLYGGIFQSGSNSATWGPFNSQATDDPIPVNSRGLYFDGVARYLVSTSNIVMNYQSSVAMWIYPQNVYMPMCTVAFYYYAIGYGGITLTNPDGAWYQYTYNVEVLYNQWVFGAYTISFASDTTTVTYTTATAVTSVLSVNGYAFHDSGSLMWIGKYATYAYYYQGFIYSFTLWQTAITSFTSAYDTCGTGLGNSCVTNCGLTQYYNPYEGTCASCDSACTSGCATWGTCAKCQYPGCATCTDFNATCSPTVTSPCNPGYTYSSTNHDCCNSACTDCYGPYSYNCKSCSASYYLLSQVCLSSCPVGYSGNPCAVYLNPFLNVLPNQIKDVVVDSARGISFETGVDTSFYPSGKSSDPIPAMNRGYYFTSTSYMSSQALTLPYNFTMIFYIKHISGGTLFSKNTLSISTSGSVTFTITSVITATFSAITNTDWMVMSFSLWTTMDGTTSVSLTYPPAAASTSSASNVIFLDNSLAIYFGAASGSFTGFLYQFLMYAYPQDVSTLTATMCATSSDTSCLWNCDIGYYLSGSTCTTCSGTCTGGCVRGTDCNLCSDVICSSCTSFTSACTTCLSNASLVSSVCQCNANYYWTSSHQCLACPSNTFSVNGGSCTNCDATCLTCSGSSTSCLSCYTHASLVSNTCTCNGQYYWTGSSCAACNTRCQTCPDASQCTTCITNAVLDGSNNCNCATSFYWTGTACSACYSECQTCTTTSTTCTSCFSNAALQGASCSCNSHYYWAGSACAGCDPTCLTCSGSSSSQCLSCNAHASLSSNVCTCDTSFIWTGSQCSACYSSCLTCSGTAFDQCVSCTTGLTLQGDHSCSCNAFYYFDATTSTCLACDSTCASCSGSNNNDCLTCRAHASLSNGYCSCDAGWYWDGISACDACDASCLECTGPTADDCICLEHSTQVGMVCVCDEGYYMDANTCQLCQSSCLTCTGPTYYQCTSCLDYLLEVVCLSVCPIGFLGSSNNCTIENSNSPTVEYVFNTIQGVFYDSINHTGAITGDNEGYYPNLDASDPVPAYERGIYFTGIGSYLALPYPDANLLLFGIRFSISAWINPNSVNGTLFYKAQTSSSLLSVTLKSLYTMCYSKY